MEFKETNNQYILYLLQLCPHDTRLVWSLNKQTNKQYILYLLQLRPHDTRLVWSLNKQTNKQYILYLLQLRPHNTRLVRSLNKQTINIFCTSYSFVLITRGWFGVHTNKQSIYRDVDVSYRLLATGLRTLRIRPMQPQCVALAKVSRNVTSVVSHRAWWCHPLAASFLANPLTKRTHTYAHTHTKTMIPMRKSMPRSCRQLDLTKTS